MGVKKLQCHNLSFSGTEDPMSVGLEGGLVSHCPGWACCNVGLMFILPLYCVKVLCQLVCP